MCIIFYPRPPVPRHSPSQMLWLQQLCTSVQSLCFSIAEMVQMGHGGGRDFSFSKPGSFWRGQHCGGPSTKVILDQMNAAQCNAEMPINNLEFEWTNAVRRSKLHAHTRPFDVRCLLGFAAGQGRNAAVSSGHAPPIPPKEGIRPGQCETA